MANLDKLIPLIAELGPAEREALASLLFEDFYPYPGRRSKRLRYVSRGYPSIVSTPGICGGAARLIRTRIPVWTLERMRQLGLTDAEILTSYPNLQAADLVQAWAYADGHRSEIDLAIQQNEADDPPA